MPVRRRRCCGRRLLRLCRTRHRYRPAGVRLALAREPFAPAGETLALLRPSLTLCSRRASHPRRDALTHTTADLPACALTDVLRAALLTASSEPAEQSPARRARPAPSQHADQTAPFDAVPRDGSRAAPALHELSCSPSGRRRPGGQATSPIRSRLRPARRAPRPARAPRPRLEQRSPSLLRRAWRTRRSPTGGPARSAERPAPVVLIRSRTSATVRIRSAVPATASRPARLTGATAPRR